MKKAFTMIELVFVIVIIGILAAVIIPNTKTNPVPEAAIQLISHLRYTQHLAISNDKYGQNATWYRDRWQVVFSGIGNNLYSIVSDSNNTNFARNPQNSQANLQNIKLKSVTATLGGGCVGQNIISFDNMGRPMVGSLTGTNTAYVAANLLQNDCTILISNGSETATVNIKPETGYATIAF